MQVYQPDEQILQQRAEFSKAFSALRRIRPHVPFWKLAAHRIPTLWTLYRGLLKNAPGENVKWRIRRQFEIYRSLTSPQATREKLLQGHKFLEFFSRAVDGDMKCQKTLSRYERLIGAKRAKKRTEAKILEQLAWQERLRTRPIMTGGFLRPSVLNKPLPRLKPQPQHISVMLAKRRRAYSRMGEKYVMLKELEQHVASEMEFEKRLMRMLPSNKWQQFHPVFYEVPDWMDAIRSQKTSILNSIELAVQRATSAYHPKMLAAIKEARREKIRNKTRERERARRGEVMRKTIEMARKGPPAHVLEKMTEWEKHADKVIRIPTEVGYVGMMKSRLGVKMKNPDLWRRLEGGYDAEGKDDLNMEREVSEGVEKPNEDARRCNEEGRSESSRDARNTGESE